MLTGGQRDRIERYLAALERALGPTPAEERIEVVAGVREHIESALADLAAATDEPTDADVDAVLRQLGDPLTIAAATGSSSPAPAARRMLLTAAWVPTTVVLLIGTGTVLFFMVLPLPMWLVGVVLLWTSSLWRITEKLWGTLVPLVSMMIFVVASTTTGSTQTCSAISPAGSSERPEVVCTSGPSPVVTALAWALVAALVIAVGLAMFVLWRRGTRRVPATLPEGDSTLATPRGA